MFKRKVEIVGEKNKRFIQISIVLYKLETTYSKYKC